MKKKQKDEPIVVTRYYDDGSKESETTFVNGVENGEYKSWYYNGKLAWTGHYKNGLMDGDWREYDNYAGHLIGRDTYREGKLHGRSTSWDTHGTRFEDNMYLNGHMIKDMFDDDADEWLEEHREIFE